MKKSKKILEQMPEEFPRELGNSVPDPARAKVFSILNLAVFKNLYVVSKRKRIHYTDKI